MKINNIVTTCEFSSYYEIVLQFCTKFKNLQIVRKLYFHYFALFVSLINEGYHFTCHKGDNSYKTKG